MYTVYIVPLIILLIFFISIQLILFNIHVIKLRKSKELNKQRIKEETEWEFIKGLY